ncbi:SixA phosphatase family protein, partial [Flavihumibacter solisilvae]|uniref:SixA phosphatase family protein n=1 Tax=Flavihumibacter solisilvae TaxID=1349421 RepID=UPI000690CDC6
MLNRLPVLLFPILLTGCASKYFIVRHAEKAQTTAQATQSASASVMQTPNNPPLSAVGEARAIALKDRLASEQIRKVYSTNTIRTLTTAAPTASHFNVQVQTYAKVDSAFIALLKTQKGNVLIVGHSNTVDDIVNGLTGTQQLSDLPETEYDN